MLELIKKHEKVIYGSLATLVTAMAFFMTKYSPFILALAEPKVKVNSTIENIIGWAAGVGGGIIAIFLIVSIVKDGIEFAKGQGSVSIWKIVGKVLFLILCIGLIFLATNYEKLGNKAKDLGDKGVNIVDENAGDWTGGNGN